MAQDEKQIAVAAAEADAEAWQNITSGRWPFRGLCEQLCLDMLSPQWETRHGAAVALREVLRTHAASAAVDVTFALESSGILALNNISKEI